MQLQKATFFFADVMALIFLPQGTTDVILQDQGTVLFISCQRPGGSYMYQNPRSSGSPLVQARDRFGDLLLPCGFRPLPALEAARVLGISREVLTSKSEWSIFKREALSSFLYDCQDTVYNNSTAGLTNQNHLCNEKNILNYQLSELKHPDTFGIFFTSRQGWPSLQNPWALFVPLVALREKVETSQLP